MSAHVLACACALVLAETLRCRILVDVVAFDSTLEQATDSLFCAIFSKASLGINKLIVTVKAYILANDIYRR